MSAEETMAQTDDKYYVPHQSHWPIVGTAGLLFLMVGVSVWLNGTASGFWVMMVGAAIVIFMLCAVGIRGGERQDDDQPGRNVRSLVCGAEPLG